MKTVIALIFLLVVSQSLYAQNTLKVTGQIRPRFEMDDRDFNSAKAASNLTYMRSRLNAAFSSNKVNAFIQMQDSRIWGTEPSTVADMKNVDLHQAYFVLSDAFETPIDIKIGRMELLYNNERILGASNWSNVGRSFNGVVLGYNTSKFNADFLVMKEAEKLAAGDDLDQTLYALFTEIKLIDKFNINPFLFYQRGVPSTNMNRYTMGVYAKGESGGLTHETEFIYQGGEYTQALKKFDVSAYFMAINAGYTFNHKGKPMIGAGIDYYSGDNNLADNKVKTFNGLYGTAHKFLGYMDYFTDIPAHTYGLGIMDIIAKAGINATEKLKLSLFFHLFGSVEEYTLQNKTKTNSFGSEINLLANYKYSDAVGFEAGFGYFSPGEIFKEKRGKDSATWFYLTTLVNM
ncbi:MAG: alginate export family protein [Bacteroidota bacterium]